MFGSLDLVAASISFNNVSIMCEFHKEILPKFVIVTIIDTLWSSGTVTKRHCSDPNLFVHVQVFSAPLFDTASVP